MQIKYAVILYVPIVRINSLLNKAKNYIQESEVKMHIRDTRIELNIEYGNEKITFYPYETTRFNCFPPIEIRREHAIALEQYLCDHATEKFDGWRTGLYISTNGVKQDNKCTFTLKGMAYHFHDNELWVYPESAMKVGRF